MTAPLRRFWADERGSGSIEFLLLFPLVFAMFLSTVELGVFLARQAMLDRGLDLAVRDVRLGLLDPVTHASLIELICGRTALIRDCGNQLRLEMVGLDPRGAGRLDGEADCVDRADPARPVRAFVPGQSNELMVLRACVLIDPLFPTSGLGARLTPRTGGGVALLATTAFVIEPN